MKVRYEDEFVTRKITDGVAKIKLGKLDCLELGNLDAKRDWGFAKEYVEGMWLMLQAEHSDTLCWRPTAPRPFEILSDWHSNVRICRSSFMGQPKMRSQSKCHLEGLMKVNPDYYRPAEVELLIGDPAKAKAKLGWEPKTSLEELCKMMVDSDLRRNTQGFSF
ncbi:MAG: GDP-mannose 4,6-dehydratase [Burkholderiaceae bacterium]